MKQLFLPGMTEPATTSSHIVNVASVPQRSPFRYPGGKTWLVPRVRRWLLRRDSKPIKFIEPFAGGAIVGLTVAFEQLSEQVILVELDNQVAAVWQAIIVDGDAPWLSERITCFNLTMHNVNRLLAEETSSVRELAFQVIVRNRVNHGGILASGAGRIKAGENGRGIASRWYPQTLSKRILDIHAVRERIQFIHSNGLEIINYYRHEPDVVFFVDPPYTASRKRPGSRLYACSELDHAALFELLASAHGDFLMTYDDDQPIRELALQHCFDIEAVAMKNTHHAKISELLIGRDLGWARDDVPTQDKYSDRG